MPDVSKVKLPNGNTYNIKDSATASLTQNEITAGTDTSNKFISAKVLNEAIAAGNNTSATVSNETLHITTGLQVGDGVRY